MKKKLINFIENYNCAYMIVNFQKKQITYSNKKAQELYNVTTDTIDLEPIFAQNSTGLIDMFKKEVKDKSILDAFIQDVVTLDCNGQKHISNLHLGYFDKESNEIFIEIIPIINTSFKALTKILEKSNKSNIILDINEKLTVFYCNEIIRKNYHMENGYEFALAFSPEKREETVNEIIQAFADNKNTMFEKNYELYNSNGELEWFNLSFELADLEQHGVKLVCFPSSIQELVSNKNELININEYFKIIQMQTLCTILRYDIKTRILYRNEVLAKEYGIPSYIENYPNKKEVERAVYPDDIQEYLDFFDRAVQGEEGSINVRLITVDNTFEYHKISIKAIRNSDGSINEMLIVLTNVNDLKEKEIELNDVNRQFDALQELSDDLLFRIDIKNKQFIKREDNSSPFGLMNRNTDFPQQLLDNDVIHIEDIEFFYKFANNALDGVSGSVEVRMRKNLNQSYEFQRITWIPIENKDNVITEMVGKIVNIQSIKELEKQANFDSLTNILNKRAMLESTADILSSKTTHNKHALFFIDLDDFKYVNDNLGHAFGDFLLSELSKRFRENVRNEDLVGRVGGDEFVIFLRDIPSIDLAMKKASKFLSKISEKFDDGKQQHIINGSIGIAIYPEHGATYDELYHHADLALYSSKGKGKNTITLYNVDMGEDK